MKKLFIYYSLSGNLGFVANYLKAIGYDTREVTPKEHYSKNNFFRIMKGGFLASMNYKSKLLKFDTSLSDYDEVIIGSPIWNARLSCPINAVLSACDLSNKRVSFILSSGSGEAPKAVKKINTDYPYAEIKILKEPLKNHDELKKILF